MDPLQIVIDGVDNASGVIDGVGGALGGLADIASGALSAGFALAAAGATALVAGLGASLSAAMDNEKLQAQLAATIKATGGAAGLTADDANELAQQFKNLAGGSDDAIIAIETIGLRAGTISADEMPAFIQSTLDLGAVMGSTTAAAELLARAQDDPVAAFKKLEKATGSFDSALEDQIKTMVDAGDTAGALDLINQKLAETTGGAAAANAETLSGQIEIMQGALGEAAETIGTALLPFAKELFEQVIAPAIPIVETLAGAFASFFTDLQEGTPKEALDALGQTLTAVFGPEMAEQITGFVDGLMQGIGGFVAFFQSNMPLIQETAGVVFGAIASIGQTLAAVWTDTLAPALGQVFTIIFGEAPPAQDLFAGLMAAIQSGAQIAAQWVQDVLAPAIKVFADWLVTDFAPVAADVIAWLQVNIPIAIQAATDAWNNVIYPALVAMWDYLNTNVVPMLTTLVEWIGTNVPAAMQTLTDFWNRTLSPALTAMWNFIKDYLYPIVSDLGTIAIYGLQVGFDAVADVWNDTLYPALSEMWTFIKDTLGPLFESFTDGALKGIKDGFRAFQDILGGIKDFLDDIISSINNFPQLPDVGGGFGPQTEPGGGHGPQSVSGGRAPLAGGGDGLGGWVDLIRSMDRFSDSVDRFVAAGGRTLADVGVFGR